METPRGVYPREFSNSSILENPNSFWHFTMALSLFEQDELEDSKESFLNAQSVLKLCAPPVHLYSKPKKLRGRWHYSFSEGSKNDVRDAKQKKSQHYLQTRLSDVSFATFEEANCWHAKRAYAEKLLTERLPSVAHAPKPIPVGTFFVCDFFFFGMHILQFLESKYLSFAPSLSSFFSTCNMY